MDCSPLYHLELRHAHHHLDLMTLLVMKNDRLTNTDPHRSEEEEEEEEEECTLPCSDLPHHSAEPSTASPYKMPRAIFSH